uniref:Uncharacterized protein n=1 Tax=Pithovirus LCPAC403 TaxID=2506596 RepID=A0A481ZEB6_9VIRU|nr:MAG: hypothetical protein LCPAC403_01150 [Pithovirus LCPAC403]
MSSLLKRKADENMEEKSNKKAKIKEYVTDPNGLIEKVHHNFLLLCFELSSLSALRLGLLVGTVGELTSIKGINLSYCRVLFKPFSKMCCYGKSKSKIYHPAINVILDMDKQSNG